MAGQINQLISEVAFVNNNASAKVNQLIAEGAFASNELYVQVNQLVAEAMYRFPPQIGIDMTGVALERVVAIKPSFQEAYARLNNIAVERVVRRYIDLRSWGVLNNGTFVSFEKMGFYISEIAGADVASYDLDAYSRVRYGEIPNGEVYGPRKIRLTGRIIGNGYADITKKTDALLALLRPGTHARALGYSDKIMLAYFGKNFYLVTPVKLSGEFSMQYNAENACYRDITLEFTSQDFPFMLRYEKSMTLLSDISCNAHENYPYAVLSVNNSSGDVESVGSPIVSSGRITCGVATNNYVFIAGSFTALSHNTEYGYAAWYDINAGVWKSFSRSVSNDTLDTLKTITCASPRTDDVIFVGSSGGRHYAMLWLKADGGAVSVDEVNADPGAPVISIAVMKKYGVPVVLLSNGKIRYRNITAASWYDVATITGAQYIATYNNVIYAASQTSVYKVDVSGTYKEIHQVSGGVIKGLIGTDYGVVVHGNFGDVDGIIIGGIFATVNGRVDTLSGGIKNGNIISASYSSDAGLVVTGELTKAIDEPAGGKRWLIMSYKGARWLPNRVSVAADGVSQYTIVTVSGDRTVILNANLNKVNIGKSITVNNQGETTPFTITIAATSDLWLPLIINHTTGQYILLETNHMLVGGETITINTKDMSVESNASWRGLPGISAVSDMSAFLASGENKLSLWAYGYGTAVISFNPAIDSIGATE